MAELKVGVIGVGHMGRAHVEGFQRVTETEVVAVTDTAPVAEVGPGFAAKYGVDYEESLDSLLARPDIDAVAITTPHSLHMDHTLRALEAGKHVLLEKPMEVTVAKCDRIIEAAEEAGLKLMIAHSHRYWPGDALAKELIDEGAVGNLVMVRDALVSAGYRANPAPGEPRRWGLDPDLYGPGGLLAWGCHCMDRFRFWIGSEPVEIYAHGWPLRTEIPGDTTTHMIMIRFENNVSATLWYSEALPKPGWPMSHSYCRAEIVGDSGILDVNPYAFVRVGKEDGWEEVYTSQPEDNRPEGKSFQATWYTEDKEFARCVLDDTEPPITGLDGRRAVEMCLAAYESGQTGKPVALPL